MSTWEPEGWNFTDSDMKLHVFGKDNDSRAALAEIYQGMINSSRIQSLKNQV